MKFVRKTKTCWIWTGWKMRKYGYWTIMNKEIRAHRFSYMIHKGKIPKGMNVLHRCDNPPCVNPKHLFIGTQRDNIYDSIKKGRHKMCRNVKRTKEEILEMRKLYSSGFNQYQIAKLFKTKQGYISDVILRKIWNDI